MRRVIHAATVSLAQVFLVGVVYAQVSIDDLAALLSELMAVLDGLLLALRDAKTHLREALEALRHQAAALLCELADRLLASEERWAITRNLP